MSGRKFPDCQYHSSVRCYMYAKCVVKKDCYHYNNHRVTFREMGPEGNMCHYQWCPDMGRYVYCADINQTFRDRGKYRRARCRLAQ